MWYARVGRIGWVLAAMAIGCASPSPAGTSSSAAPPPAAVASPAAAEAPASVTACIPSRSDTILPMFAAQDGGYLAEQRLDANIPYFAGGQVDAALAAGQCDFVFGAGGVGPLLQGLDVVVVAVTTTF